MLLKRGSRGENVKVVQRFVGVRVDGIFGPNTESAVKKLERKLNVTVDGTIGTFLWNHINNNKSGGSEGLPGLPGGLFDKLIGGVLLYGIFKVLMKVF
jgi:hypothetical protein